ncbi:MAG: hypothetical protein ABI651_12845, partial [Verrucomicrobiota bacterium]
GAVTFGCLYLLSLLIAAANTDAAKADNRSSEADALYIPAIGPFVHWFYDAVTISGTRQSRFATGPSSDWVPRFSSSTAKKP